MKTKDNEILIIQTSDSSSIFITKDLFPYDDPDLEKMCFSICEGYNPLYWLDAWHTDLQEAINLLEFPNKSVSVKRDYISWWLNCRPSFVDDSVKSILKERLVKYHLTGEIKNTFRNAKYGLEFNSDCLLEWHTLLDVEYDKKLLDLITTEENNWYNESAEITIFFDAFLYLPYSKISLKKYLFPTYHKEVEWKDHKRHYRETQAWKNFMDECGWLETTAITWLANEWNATYTARAIIFENEQDKLMWILRWS